MDIHVQSAAAAFRDLVRNFSVEGTTTETTPARPGTPAARTAGPPQRAGVPADGPGAGDAGRGPGRGDAGVGHGVRVRRPRGRGEAGGPGGGHGGTVVGEEDGGGHGGTVVG